MTDQDLKDLIASLVIDTQALKKSQAATDKQLKELGKQLGGLGNKFGSFTEGLLLPSIETMLRREYGITDFQMRLKSKRGANLLELDGFGFVNGAKNIGFIVEVKSHLEERAITQTLKQMQSFEKFYPQYAGMTLYGIIAAVNGISTTMRTAVYDAGLYLVTVSDTDVITMQKPPKGFTPFGVLVKK